MRKVAIIGSFLSLACLWPIAAQSSNPASTSCKVLGSTKTVSGYVYTCIKAGKVLKWSIGVKQSIKVTPSPSPVSTSTPTPKPSISTAPNATPSVAVSPSPTPYVYVSPTPSVITPNLSFMNEAVTDLAKRYGGLTDKPPVDIHVEPGIESTKWAIDSVGSINRALELLIALNAKPVSKIDAYVEWNIDFMKANIDPGCYSWAGNGGGGACGTQKIWANLKWFGNQLSINSSDKMTSYPSEAQHQWIAANLQHELAHVGQFTISNKYKVYRNDKPAWLREGEAEVFKVMAFAYQFNLTYEESRKLYLANVGTRCSYTSIGKLSEAISYASSDPAINYCEYTNGMLAVEYLITKMGTIDSLFWWDAKAIGPDYRTAFESAYGVHWDQFVQDADIYIKQETNAK